MTIAYLPDVDFERQAMELIARPMIVDLAGEVARVAKEFAPVESGELRDKIAPGIEEMSGAEAGVGDSHVVVGVVYARADHSAAQEFGWMQADQFHVGQPYLRPALEVVIYSATS